MEQFIFISPTSTVREMKTNSFTSSQLIIYWGEMVDGIFIALTLEVGGNESKLFHFPPVDDKLGGNGRFRFHFPTVEVGEMKINSSISPQ